MQFDVAEAVVLEVVDFLPVYESGYLTSGMVQKILGEVQNGTYPGKLDQ